ncbi:MAG: hypothetical protein LC745_03295, partial [Planctomycetia bacterium]|nr:hypothetical protein [Planctomycetia bacterium]
MIHSPQDAEPVRRVPDPAVTVHTKQVEGRARPNRARAPFEGVRTMSIDKSLKKASSLTRARNVLT